jgi:hypothetical protein
MRYPQITDEQRATILSLVTGTDLSYNAVARAVNKNVGTVSKAVKDVLGDRYYNERMTRVKKPKKAFISGGYRRVPTPDWFKGHEFKGFSREHHVVYCEANGLTHIPDEFCVHHIDGNPLNNDISNLQLMTHSTHARHHLLERLTTAFPCASQTTRSNRG